VRVVQVNTADRKGGAAIAAYRIHCGLRDISGIDSRLLVGIKVTRDASVHSCYGTAAGYRLSRLNHRLLDRFCLGGVFQLPPAPDANRLLHSADLIHLHNIHGGFFSYCSLLQMARTIPMIWTLHDMWSFTGYCAYSNDCKRWLTGCGSCPQLTAPGAPTDRSAWHWERKKNACRDARLTIVAPSRWLADLAKESPIHGHLDVHCIPNGVETDIFCPQDRTALRRSLNIPERAYVLLAQGDARKGSGRLTRILGALPEELRRSVFLILVAETVPPELLQLLGAERVQATGYVATQERMAQLYGMADLFLLPTEADNLPNTLLESISCGTPAVTFDVGGCPDVIRHMETGYVARFGDNGNFAEGIGFLLNHCSTYNKMRERCRTVAMSEFDVSVAVQHYLKLYDSM